MFRRKRKLRPTVEERSEISLHHALHRNKEATKKVRNAISDAIETVSAHSQTTYQGGSGFGPIPFRNSATRQQP